MLVSMFSFSGFAFQVIVFEYILEDHRVYPILNDIIVDFKDVITVLGSILFLTTSLLTSQTVDSVSHVSRVIAGNLNVCWSLPCPSEMINFLEVGRIIETSVQNWKDRIFPFYSPLLTLTHFLWIIRVFEEAESLCKMVGNFVFFFCNFFEMVDTPAVV